MTQTVELRVERYRETCMDAEPGYLPMRRTREMQRLVRTTTAFFGLLRVRSVLGVEEIPEHAVISLGCFGDTGGWHSKFRAYIDARAAAAG